MKDQLIDIDTLYQLKKAAPEVTVVPFDLACWVVRSLDVLSKTLPAHVDQHGVTYWKTTIKDVTEKVTQVSGITPSQVGRSLRRFGLEEWREMDGYHVAWSQTQLEILKKFFKA